jgi:hypothetical protein
LHTKAGMIRSKLITTWKCPISDIPTLRRQFECHPPKRPATYKGQTVDLFHRGWNRNHWEISESEEWPWFELNERRMAFKRNALNGSATSKRALIKQIDWVRNKKRLGWRSLKSASTDRLGFAPELERENLPTTGELATKNSTNGIRS